MFILFLFVYFVFLERHTIILTTKMVGSVVRGFQGDKASKKTRFQSEDEAYTLVSANDHLVEGLLTQILALILLGLYSANNKHIHYLL